MIDDSHTHQQPSMQSTHIHTSPAMSSYIHKKHTTTHRDVACHACSTQTRLPILSPVPQVTRTLSCTSRHICASSAWPLQEIRSLQSNLALFNHPCIAPSICIAYTIAILSHDYCAIYDPHSTRLVYAIHHTILAVAIARKGQAFSCTSRHICAASPHIATCREPPLATLAVRSTTPRFLPLQGYAIRLGPSGGRVLPHIYIYIYIYIYI